MGIENRIILAYGVALENSNEVDAIFKELNFDPWEQPVENLGDFGLLEIAPGLFFDGTGIAIFVEEGSKEFFFSREGARDISALFSSAPSPQAEDQLERLLKLLGIEEEPSWFLVSAYC